MEIVFFGSGAFGTPVLRALAQRHTVRALVTQPDRPAGRGSRTTPTPIAAAAAESVPDAQVFKPERVNDPEVRERIRAIGAEAWVVIAFGQKLGPDLLDGQFAVNLHASLLPRWRGAAPINAAVLAGDTQTGNSVITLIDRMDAGPILAQSTRPIEPDQTAGVLHDLLAGDGPELVLGVLDQHLQGQVRGRQQDEGHATPAPKLSRRDGWVDFRESAPVCRGRINGLSPWPAVVVRFRDKPLKLLRAEPAAGEPEAGSVPGTIVEAGSGLVACAGGLIRLLDVQPPGKRQMSWEDFARGRHVKPGEQLEGAAPKC
ncbi:MAG: methionyl-tRNA formyltransferase [Planctomycetes bacterium]|nr:methionyl-tRNA formyltransferase [Planctomycetota bacterium]